VPIGSSKAYRPKYEERCTLAMGLHRPGVCHPCWQRGSHAGRWFKVLRSRDRCRNGVVVRLQSDMAGTPFSEATRIESRFPMSRCANGLTTHIPGAGRFFAVRRRWPRGWLPPRLLGGWFVEGFSDLLPHSGLAQRFLRFALSVRSRTDCAPKPCRSLAGCGPEGATEGGLGLIANRCGDSGDSRISSRE
jgi:hypothetical protein